MWAVILPGLLHDGARTTRLGVPLGLDATKWKTSTRMTKPTHTHLLKFPGFIVVSEAICLLDTVLEAVDDL